MRRTRVCVLAALITPSLAVAELTASQLFAEVAERNHERDARLREYSALRTYEVKTVSGKIRAESKVSVHYRSPGPKTFHIMEEKGSSMIRTMVFHPLMEHEATTSSGDSRRDTSVTPANYSVELIGEATLGRRRCYRLRATPRRHDKYLFEGTIWVDAEDLAIAQIEGQPMKNPSFWVKKIHFVRRYQKVGGFWLPSLDTTVTDVRVFGRHTLTIQYENYQVNPEGLETR